MTLVHGLRPFVPARDFALSRRFYEAIGFTLGYQDATIAVLQMDDACFILQNYYVAAFADNCMLQLVVGDVQAWWRRIDSDGLVRDFSVKAPVPPAVQAWGGTVGFLFDPSGVLWHIAEIPPPTTD